MSGSTTGRDFENLDDHIGFDAPSELKRRVAVKAAALGKSPSEMMRNVLWEYTEDVAELDLDEIKE